MTEPLILVGEACLYVVLNAFTIISAGHCPFERTLLAPSAKEKIVVDTCQQSETPGSGTGADIKICRTRERMKGLTRECVRISQPSDNMFLLAYDRSDEALSRIRVLNYKYVDYTEISIKSEDSVFTYGHSGAPMYYISDGFVSLVGIASSFAEEAREKTIRFTSLARNCGWIDRQTKHDLPCPKWTQGDMLPEKVETPSEMRIVPIPLPRSSPN